jgi:anti-sigma regulatory factor (Ser/Thr protein kinase)
MPVTPAAVRRPGRYAREIVANEHAPHAARSFIRHVFGEQADDLLSVTDELVSNAIRHAAGTVIGVSLQQLPDGVLVEVTDADGTHSPQSHAVGSVDAGTLDAENLGESGRGLAIIAALSDRWGWRPEPHGKTVFAVVPENRQ